MSLSSNFNTLPASEALECFLGLTANDGYKQLISHLGPDPKVILT